MDPSDTPTSAPETNPAQPAVTPLVYYDLGAMLKADRHLYFVQEIFEANPRYLHLQLRVGVSFPLAHTYQVIIIDCFNAVDYSIRPKNPATLEGGLPMQYFETHPLLDSVSRYVPNTDDGKVFPPSMKFNLLFIDQSHIIAERFMLHIENEHIFRNSTKADPRAQIVEADLSRGLQWMDKFRSPAYW